MRDLCFMSLVLLQAGHHGVDLNLLVPSVGTLQIRMD